MLKKKIVKLSLVTILSLSPLVAVEFNPSQNDTADNKETYPAQKIIEQAYQTPKPQIQSDAEGQATAYLNKMGIGTGWLDKKKAYISIGVAEFSTKILLMIKVLEQNEN